MLFPILAVGALLCSGIPALLFFRNLRLYAAPCSLPPVDTAVSILIPARNEERSIEACVRAALLSRDVNFEIVVLDDHSEDRTASIVQKIADDNTRVHLASAPPLPAGWCGKQFACAVLAKLAAHPVLCFLDADVRVEPDGIARMAGALHRSGASLISGFPCQVTVTPAEQLLLPLMHFLLLGFLPLDRMRQSVDPAFGAGCGQLFLSDRDAYQKAGGHAAIRASRHDGLALPRAFRRAGFKTDLCDATPIASCRMYRNAREVFAGLLKNATEGLASPRNIVPATGILALGQIAPAALLVYARTSRYSRTLLLCTALALLCSLLPRISAAFRFRQPILAAVLHPVAICVLLAIQWTAFLRLALHLPASWKGRTYSTS